MRARTTLAAAIAAAALGAGAAPAMGAEALYGATADNRLVSFNSDSPGRILRSVPITGLVEGDSVVGIDFRPATGQLFGLGRSSRVYVIDVTTGAARPVGGGPFTPALSGAGFGFDFNPTVDRIRVVSDADQNLRLNPDTGATAATDMPLKYGPGADVATDPNVVASAYTNSVPGATSTQLFGIDSGNDAVVLQNPPNDGVLTRVASLGVDAPASVGFDIARDGTGWAAFRRGGRSELFRVALSGENAAQATAGRSAIGTDAEFVGLAAAGTVADDRSKPSLVVDFDRRASKSLLRRKGLRIEASCSETCALGATLTLGGTTVGSATGQLDQSGRRVLRITLNSAGRSALSQSGDVRFALAVTATDAAGNTITKRRALVAR
jgi:hypothetical protein